MAIRVQHQGAGAGAGIDLVAQQKRKYDLQMKQQEKQQDLMTKVGLQNREAMMRQYQDANQNTIRQGLVDAANERQDANWARDQKAAADQQRQAAANARAMKTGTISSSIDAGEYAKGDADKLREFIAQQNSILNDTQSNDDQKANALATLDGQMEPFLKRRIDRAPQGPPSWDKADPKIKQGIFDSVWKGLMDRAEQGGPQFSMDDAVAEAQKRYAAVYGSATAPSQQGVPLPQEGSPPQRQTQQPQPYGPPEGPTAPVQKGVQQAEAQQDDGLRPAPNAKIIQQDGIFYVPMDNGMVRGFRTQEQAQQFAGLGQAAPAPAPAGSTPPQASAAPQLPAQAPQPEQSQQAPQQAGAQPSPMNTDGWSPWDIKNHGKDSRGYFKGLMPRTGATIEDHTFQGGYKGFKVLREGGGASTFASRAAAEAFLTSGKQAATQQPSQSQQQSAPAGMEQQASQELPQSSSTLPLPSAESPLPQGQERYFAPSGRPMIRTVSVPESQADISISPFGEPPQVGVAASQPPVSSPRYGRAPADEPKTAKEAAKRDEKGYSRFKSDAKDILTTEYNDKRAAWEATEGTPNRPPAPVRPTIDQILQKSEELWDAEQRWFKSGGSAETPPSTAPPQTQQPKSTRGSMPTAPASDSQPGAQSPPKNEYAAYGSSPTSPQPQPPMQGGSVTGDLKPLPGAKPISDPSGQPPSLATEAPPQADRGERQQPKSTRGSMPTVPTSAVRSPEGPAKSSTISNFTGKERLGGFRPAPGAKVQVSPDGKQFSVTDSKGKPIQFGSKEKAQEFIDTEKLETLAGEQNDLMSGKSKSFGGDYVEGSDGQLKWIEGAAYDPAAFNWDTAIKATEPALRKAKENIREFASTQPKPVQDAIQIMLDETANKRDKVRATDILRIAKVDLKAIMQGKNGTSGTNKKKP